MTDWRDNIPKENRCYDKPEGILYNCDCREILPKFPKDSIDLVLTDPPYAGHFGDGSTFLHTSNTAHYEIMDFGAGNFDIVPYFPELMRTCNPLNLYCWCSKTMLLPILEFIGKNQLNWDLLVWVKNAVVPAKNNKYLPDTELCFFIRKSGAFFNNKSNFDDYRKAIISDYVSSSQRCHPTQKPIKVILPAIRISCPQNGIILDPFLGSGTTALAAKELGRRFIGIEISPEYCQMAIRRLGQGILL